MAAIDTIMHTFMGNFTDPRVVKWTMMGSPVPTLSIIAVYLLLVLFILPAFMKNRKPYQITQIIKIYNIFQVATCVTIIYNTLNSGWIQGEYSIGCAPVDYSDRPTAVKMVSQFYWLYLLKGAELIETVFFALRKKFNQISGLHVYHHASTFFLSYIGCKFIGGGMASVPLIVNSFIHVLMYTYYYLSSMGPRWQNVLKPWKPRLTMCQMIQFTLLIIHSLSALQPDCEVPKQFLLIYVPNVIVIFKMFYDFYQSSYTKSTKSKKNEQKNGLNGHKK
ncbi:unnamed protein product, partial [Psylliodes chrysocephalus]